MNANALAAAHRSLPFGTRVRVDNLKNGRSVVVRINDRGPFVRGRVIDLTRGAAARIGMIGSGTASVRVTVVDGSRHLQRLLVTSQAKSSSRSKATDLISATTGWPIAMSSARAASRVMRATSI